MFFLIGCSQKDEESNDKSIPVKIFKVQPESISQYIRATGTVEANEDVVLYSKVADRVKSVKVNPGQSVTQNQILVEQDNAILLQGLEISNAAMKSAESQVKLATADFERMNKLFSERAISQQQFDQAKLVKETAEHAFVQAKSMYEQAKEQYENSYVKAPFDGIVAAVFVEKNQTIGIGQPVVQLVSPSKMKAKVYLTGDDIYNVQNGQRVIIKFPTIPDKEYEGRVNKINTAIDKTSKSLEVEIALLTRDKNVKSGIFGEYYIEIKHHTNSLVVPEVALLPQTEIKIDRETGLQSTLKKYFIFLIENNRAKLKEVKTGIANDGQIEIISGLNPGDSVIIVGQNIIKEGQTVNIIE